MSINETDNGQEQERIRPKSDIFDVYPISKNRKRI
jgi:hypothetical protein